MSLSIKQIQQLQRLLRGETIAWSSLNNDMRNTLIGDDLIIIKTNRSRKSIYVPNAEALKMFLEQHFEELRGKDWDSDNLVSSTSRAELAVNSGNSKTKEIRSCPGFMVNSYDPVYAKLNGKDIVIAPQEGTMLFVADWDHFEIPKEVLVVGIENMENFHRIREQRHLFPTDRPILFVSRYPQSTDLRNWLQNISNDYFHFGGFPEIQSIVANRIWLNDIYNKIFFSDFSVRVHEFFFGTFCAGNVYNILYLVNGYIICLPCR